MRIESCNNCNDGGALGGECYCDEDDMIPRAEAQAMVAAALTEAAARVQSVDHHGWTRTDLAQMILASITPDARAALDRAIAAALESAINVVTGCDRVSEVQPAIRALIRPYGDRARGNP